MDDLGRFFRQVVRHLAATDSARLKGPLRVSEIRETILPYRANRRALELETSEDYELVLIRLCAGEGGLARTEPEEAHADFAAEAGNANPDLAVVHRHENAAIILDGEQVARALGPASPELAFAPPEQRRAAREPAAAGSAPEQLVTGEDPDTSPPICRACGRALPLDRRAKFCPHCGEGHAPSHCRRCQTELEPGWRHCIGCGAAVE